MQVPAHSMFARRLPRVRVGTGGGKPSPGVVRRLSVVVPPPSGACRRIWPCPARSPALVPAASPRPAPLRRPSCACGGTDGGDPAHGEPTFPRARCTCPGLQGFRYTSQYPQPLSFVIVCIISSRNPANRFHHVLSKVKNELSDDLRGDLAYSVPLSAFLHV
jgi:hypothetical protein